VRIVCAPAIGDSMYGGHRGTTSLQAQTQVQVNIAQGRHYVFWVRVFAMHNHKVVV